MARGKLTLTSPSTSVDVFWRFQSRLSAWLSTSIDQKKPCQPDLLTGECHARDYVYEPALCCNTGVCGPDLD